MRSMKRPSRRLRESATTTLKNGRFLEPPRENRIITMGNLPKLNSNAKGREFYAILRRYGKTKASSNTKCVLRRVVFPTRNESNQLKFWIGHDARHGFTLHHTVL